MGTLLHMDFKRIKSPTLHWIGLVGFYWFVLTIFWGIDGHYTAMCLLAFYFFFWAPKNWHLMKKSSLFWLTLCFTTYAALRIGIDLIQNPEDIVWHQSYNWPFITIGGIVALMLVPLLTQDSKHKRLSWAFVVVLLSLMIQVLLETLIREDGLGIEGLFQPRPGFQMGPNSFGLVCGILLLGTIALGCRWLRFAPKKWSILNLARTLLLMILCASLTLGLIVTESRASWLATCISALLTILLLIRHYNFRSVSNQKNQEAIVALSFLIILVGLTYFQWERIEKRFLAEKDSIKQMLLLEFDSLPERSFGKRFYLWNTGIKALPERPIFGWSPTGVQRLIEKRTPYEFRHLHSTPVQFATAFGAFGFVLFFALTCISLVEVIKATKTRQLPYEWGVFWLGALLLLAIEGQFDFPMHDKEVQSLIVFLSAIGINIQLERIRLERLNSYNSNELTKRRV